MTTPPAPAALHFTQLAADAAPMSPTRRGSFSFAGAAGCEAPASPTTDRYRWNPYSLETSLVMTPSPSPSGSSPAPQRSPSASEDDAADEEAAAPLWSDVRSAVMAPFTWSEPSGDVSAMSHLIMQMRTVEKDATIQRQVAAMPPHELAVLERCLSQQPALVVDLCLKDRGVVVCHLVETAGGAAAARVFDIVAAHMDTLVFDQSGCIAVTRVYDAAAPGQRAIIEAFVVTRAPELAANPFGNYLVQRVIEGRDPIAMAQMGRALGEAAALMGLTVSKCGSHVVEKFLKLADDVAALAMCAAVIGNPAVLAQLVLDRFGNYALQAALRRLFAMTGPDAAATQATARAVVTSAAQQSPHQLNIRRAMRPPQPPMAPLAQQQPPLAPAYMPCAPPPPYSATVAPARAMPPPPPYHAACHAV